MTDKAKQGRSNRRKGGRVELELVKRLVASGLKALKVPLSGAMRGWKGDIEVQVSDSMKLTCEVKSRKDGGGFKTLESWLGNNDALFLHRNRAEPLVVLPFGKFIELLGLPPTIPVEETK